MHALVSVKEPKYNLTYTHQIIGQSVWILYSTHDGIGSVFCNLNKRTYSSEKWKLKIENIDWFYDTLQLENIDCVKIERFNLVWGRGIFLKHYCVENAEPWTPSRN